MLIGVPKEIKTNENRVALVPSGAETLITAGHQVMIEAGAGIGTAGPVNSCSRTGPGGRSATWHPLRKGHLRGQQEPEEAPQQKNCRGALHDQASTIMRPRIL